MKYELLNNLSGVAILLIITLVFTMLFETRYSKKKYLSSLIPFLVILFSINFYIIFTKGFAFYGKVTLLFATLPSLIYFYITSKHRDGRFFFTFCLVDTSAIWFAIVTGIIDYYSCGNGMVNFFVRIFSIPIIIGVVYKWFRKPFLRIINTVEKGWTLLTAITGLVYILLVLLSSFPVSLRYRPDEIPFTIFFMIFLFLAYMTIFYLLITQQKLHDMGTIQHIFKTQSDMMEARAREINNTEEKIRIARHDLRHKLKIVEELALKGNQEQMLSYLNDVQNSLENTKVKRYCTNVVLDAILSSYFHQAEEKEIDLEYSLNISDELPVLSAELATVIANALENAINACAKLPISQRKIIFNFISNPVMMFEIKNPYSGEIYFDKNGMPVTNKEGHGLGTRSISAFCKKYDATCIFEAKDNWFKIMVSL